MLAAAAVDAFVKKGFAAGVKGLLDLFRHSVRVTAAWGVCPGSERDIGLGGGEERRQGGGEGGVGDAVPDGRRVCMIVVVMMMVMLGVDEEDDWRNTRKQK